MSLKQTCGFSLLCCRVEAERCSTKAASSEVWLTVSPKWKPEHWVIQTSFEHLQKPLNPFTILVKMQSFSSSPWLPQALYQHLMWCWYLGCSVPFLQFPHQFCLPHQFCSSHSPLPSCLRFLAPAHHGVLEGLHQDSLSPLTCSVLKKDKGLRGCGRRETQRILGQKNRKTLNWLLLSPFFPPPA